MEVLYHLLVENDPKGYYSMEDINLLCRDPKFQTIFQNVTNILQTDQIITNDIREYFANSNYNHETALQIEEDRQNYGNASDIQNWENYLTYDCNQKSSVVL